MHLLADNDLLPLAMSLGTGATVGIRDDLLQDPECGPLLRAYLALTSGSVGIGLTPSDRRAEALKPVLHACRFLLGQATGSR